MINQTVLGGKLAARALRLPKSPVLDMTLVDLSSELPAGITSPTLREITIDAIDQHLCDHYSRRPGLAQLCGSVASALTAAGVEVDESMVTICGGVAEARYVCLRALAVDQTVYSPSPLPSVYRAALEFASASIREFDITADLPLASGGLLLISNPSPVTGQLCDEATLRRLASWVTQSKLMVISDESIGPLRFGVVRHRFAALPDMGSCTLTIGSFSESPGLGAWHVSWFAGVKALSTPARDLKQSITIASAAASQYAALAAGAELFSGALDKVRTNELEEILVILDRHNIDYFRPDTAAFVVAKDANATAVVAECQSAGIIIGDGVVIGNPGTIRIAVPSGHGSDALTKLDAVFSRIGEIGNE